MGERGNCKYCKGHGWNWQLPTWMNAFAMKMEAITRLSRKVTCHSCLGSGSSSSSPINSQELDA